MNRASELESSFLIKAGSDVNSKFLSGGLIILAVTLLLGLFVFNTESGGTMMMKAFVVINKPSGSFEPSTAALAPDYARRVNWAAHPELEDPADQIPQGIGTDASLLRPRLGADQPEQAVNVFFVHPTGLMNQATWTSPMNESSATEENTHFMMANQASVFNGCCDIYAPRYREANIFTYFIESDAQREALLDFAYQDVRRAFEHFLIKENQGKPFILAGHSQGSHHLQRLIEEVVDPSDLHRSMVAAYLPGTTIRPIARAWFEGLRHVRACESATDTGCVLSWDTMPDGGALMPRDGSHLCTNPLSWKVDEVRADAALNLGALEPVGVFNANIGSSDDTPTGQVYRPLTSPIKGLTWAKCEQGTLIAAAELPKQFPREALGTYHQLDYALFYMNIYENAVLRANQYVSDRGR